MILALLNSLINKLYVKYFNLKIIIIINGTKFIIWNN